MRVGVLGETQPPESREGARAVRRGRGAGGEKVSAAANLQSLHTQPHLLQDLKRNQFIRTHLSRTHHRAYEMNILQQLIIYF